MSYQKVVKSQQKCSHQSVKMSSYISLSDHCNSIPSFRGVIHSEPLLNVNVHRKFHLICQMIVQHCRTSDLELTATCCVKLRLSLSLYFQIQT